MFLSRRCSVRAFPIHNRSTRASSVRAFLPHMFLIRASLARLVMGIEACGGSSVNYRAHVNVTAPHLGNNKNPMDPANINYTYYNKNTVRSLGVSHSSYNTF